jgi:preprotein translocase subunit YajC
LALLASGSSAIAGCPETVEEYSSGMKFDANGVVCFKSDKGFVLAHKNADAIIDGEDKPIKSAFAIYQRKDGMYKVTSTEDKDKELKLYFLPEVDYDEQEIYLISKDHVFDVYSSDKPTKFVVFAKDSNVELIEKSDSADIFIDQNFNETDYNETDYNETGSNSTMASFTFTTEKDQYAKINVDIYEKPDDIEFEFAGFIPINGAVSTTEIPKQLPNLDLDRFSQCKNEFQTDIAKIELTNNKACLMTDLGFVIATQNVTIYQQVSGSGKSPNASKNAFAVYPSVGAYYLIEVEEKASTRKSLDTKSLELFALPESETTETLTTSYFIVTKAMEFDVTSFFVQENGQYKTGSKKDLISIVADKATVTITPGEHAKIMGVDQNEIEVSSASVTSFSVVYNDTTEDGNKTASAHVKVVIKEDSVLAKTIPEFSGYLKEENKDEPLKVEELEQKQELPEDYSDNKDSGDSTDTKDSGDSTVTKDSGDSTDTKGSENHTDNKDSEQSSDDKDKKDDGKTTTIIIVVVVVVVVIVVVLLIYFLVIRKSDGEPEKENIDIDEENGEQLKEGEVFLGVNENNDPPEDDNKDEFAL